MTDNHIENFTANGGCSFTDRPPLKSPLDKIRRWYESQQDKRIAEEFVCMISFFHPDQTIGRQKQPEIRSEKFLSYLTVPIEQSREAVSRTATMIGLIDLVVEAKEREEKECNVPDATNFKWWAWFSAWRELKNSSLHADNINRWFFSTKSL